MSDFKTAILITIDDAHEGGYQSMHGDSGNWTGGQIGVGELKGTKYGISADEFPNEDIKNLTVDRAVELYREGYWKQHYSEITDQLIANKLFDLGVLFGVGSAVKVLQIVLDLKPDGAFGPVTLEKLNSVEPITCLAAFKSGMVTHCIEVVKNKPEDRQFFKDWVRRINS